MQKPAQRLLEVCWPHTLLALGSYLLQARHCHHGGGRDLISTDSYYARPFLNGHQTHDKLAQQVLFPHCTKEDAEFHRGFPGHSGLHS